MRAAPPLSVLSSRVQSGEVVPIRGRRSRPDWPSYLEVTISASDSRNVRDPSAPRAIRNKQEPSPTRVAQASPLKNHLKKPDPAYLRNLMDEFDDAATLSPSSDSGVEVPANPPPAQASSAFQAASSEGSKPAVAEPQGALKSLGEGANDAARNSANSATQTRADADPPERHSTSPGRWPAVLPPELAGLTPATPPALTSCAVCFEDFETDFPYPDHCSSCPRERWACHPPRLAHFVCLTCDAHIQDSVNNRCPECRADRAVILADA